MGRINTIRKYIQVVQLTKLYLLLAFSLWMGTLQAQNMKHEKIRPNITITGHRGAAALAPENTMLSIRKAILLGVERVEIDVHQSKDGEIVVIHDHTLDRTTNGSGKIKNYTYKDLRTFEIDSSGERISTLQDAINSCNNKAILVIEIKKSHGYYMGIEEKIVKIIQDNGLRKNCIIHAFDSKVLKTVHKLDPEIELHKLVLVGHIGNFKSLDFVTEFSIYYKTVRKKQIDKIHSLGKKVNAWTVNDTYEIADLVKMGVDGIITDDPGLIPEALK
ncbi:MAG: hypothetical protein JKX74_01700 [Flavobacteriales bacterium]|nr:hypothetical protein [Flavobacteriales bacterium]